MKFKNVLYFMPVIVSACQSAPERPGNLTGCPAVRPKICTMIYAPVCATEKDGQLRTYSSDCTACSHAEVTGYQQGKCVKRE